MSDELAPDLTEWIVFKRDISSTNKVELKEIGCIPAVDGPRAMLAYSEEHPEVDGKRLLAFQRDDVLGEKIRLRHIANFDTGS